MGTTALEDPETRAEHNSDRFKGITKKLEDPAKRAKHNERQYVLVTKRRENPAERAKYNERQLEIVPRNGEILERKCNTTLERYRTMKGELKSVTLKYLSEITEGTTFVCSCCGCLHFRKTVVILKRETLVLANVMNPHFVKQVLLSFE